MDWQIDSNWSWPIASPAGSRIFWKCKLPGKTCGFRTWSYPKSDPTLQMQISMQMQMKIRMQTQFEVIFASFGSVWSDFRFRLGPFSLRFSTTWALQVQMQVHMQVHMQSQMQLLFD